MKDYLKMPKIEENFSKKPNKYYNNINLLQVKVSHNANKVLIPISYHLSKKMEDYMKWMVSKNAQLITDLVKRMDY
jgi:hypothetical protein